MLEMDYGKNEESEYGGMVARRVDGRRLGRSFYPAEEEKRSKYVIKKGIKRKTCWTVDKKKRS